MQSDSSPILQTLKPWHRKLKQFIKGESESAVLPETKSIVVTSSPLTKTLYYISLLYYCKYDKKW